MVLGKTESDHLVQLKREHYADIRVVETPAGFRSDPESIVQRFPGFDNTEHRVIVRSLVAIENPLQARDCFRHIRPVKSISSESDRIENCRSGDPDRPKILNQLLKLV